MNIIEVQNLTKEFTVYKDVLGKFKILRSFFKPNISKVLAVNDLSFTIAKGEIVGFLGPNGAGKSTTIKMITGVLNPSRGELSVGGLSPFKERIKHSRNIGVVFGQKSQLWWDLPAYDSFMLLGKIYGLSKELLAQRIEKMVKLFDLESFLMSPVRKLSLGQRMRCEIAAALLHSPQILFLDEPTIGMDLISKDHLHDHLRMINRVEGVTILLTTHDMKDVESLCKRVMVINHGKLIQDAPIDKIKNLFGQHKKMLIEYDGPFVLPDFGDEIKTEVQESKKLTIEFESSRTEQSKLMRKVIDAGTIKNISIVDQDLESVIKRVFTS